MATEPGKTNHPANGGQKMTPDPVQKAPAMNRPAPSKNPGSVGPAPDAYPI